jgi:succinate dehydrogenase hydrophobic anchor subunit
MTRKSGLWPWFGQRATGLFLAFGLLVHVIKIHVIDKEVDFGVVAGKLTSPGWVFFDFLLLAACIYHGFNGVWSIYLDSDPEGRERVVWSYIAFVFGAALLVYGSMALGAYAKAIPEFRFALGPRWGGG